ncbi:SDR family NAD(P)-dependent oxidoreductase [Mucilaginibacter dorajii]|uniref:Short-chain dehydrogenase/reductase SDR n=1 Tax=Mucilaginibacter dorajii TaxID=692994 RepID=A0ABP7Q181_9SPHI|nr:SDR family NAD(P)-dependent oxidoreductase [Mucilaginibacter dorajii]MCS3732839.1 NADP-dependent 3-hydroxy acid dehydrogenase YdfG [Mucilaginibacter dorajii]
MNAGKVWFITGTSKGLRLTLVRNLLDEGYRVAVTTNNLNSLKTLVSDLHKGRCLPLLVNARDKASQGRALLETINYFGQIDEVVNDARLWKNMR